MYSREKENTCYIGVQTSLLGIVEAIIFICTEYFMWKSASVKHRRRIIRAGFVVGGKYVFS